MVLPRCEEPEIRPRKKWNSIFMIGLSAELAGEHAE
jgi:hypothetical protein